MQCRLECIENVTIRVPLSRRSICGQSQLNPVYYCLESDLGQVLQKVWWCGTMLVTSRSGLGITIQQWQNRRIFYQTISRLAL